MQNAGRKKYVVVAILSLVFVVCMGTAAYTAFRVGQAWARNSILSELTYGYPSPFFRLPRHQRLSVSLKGAFTFHAAGSQDQWIAQVVYPDVRDGYYVDVGSGDGARNSNTKVLDDLGWNGICIDPFPTNMDQRTAKLFKEVVYSEVGHKVQFRDAGFVGGIEDHLDHTKGWEAVREAQTVEFTTTTLDDILSRADAPDYIHYMSIDIEGAELEALKGLSLSRYKIGAFTIEHNSEEPKRSQIQSLLERQGYRKVCSFARDDFYILDGSIGASKK